MDILFLVKENDKSYHLTISLIYDKMNLDMSSYNAFLRELKAGLNGENPVEYAREFAQEYNMGYSEKQEMLLNLKGTSNIPYIRDICNERLIQMMNESKDEEIINEIKYTLSKRNKNPL